MKQTVKKAAQNNITLKKSQLITSKGAVKNKQAIQNAPEGCEAVKNNKHNQNKSITYTLTQNKTLRSH